MFVGNANLIRSIIPGVGAGGSVIPPSPLLTGLASSWEMNESSSPATLVDVHGGRIGTVTGTLTSVAGVGGDLSLSFPTSAYVDIPHAAALNPLNAITVEVWVYVNADTGVNQTLVSKVASGSTHLTPFFSWSLHLIRVNATTWTPRWWVACSDGSDSRLALSNITIATWYQLIGMYSSGQLHIFLNNVKSTDPSPRTGTLNQYTSPVRINAVGNLTEPGSVRLNRFRVWSDTMLSDGLVTSLWNSGNGLNYPLTI